MTEPLDLNFNYLTDAEVREFVMTNGVRPELLLEDVVRQAITINRNAAGELGKIENPVTYPFPYPTPAWIALDRATRFSYPASSYYTPEQILGLAPEYVQLF